MNDSTIQSTASPFCPTALGAPTPTREPCAPGFARALSDELATPDESSGEDEALGGHADDATDDATARVIAALVSLPREAHGLATLAPVEVPEHAARVAATHEEARSPGPRPEGADVAPSSALTRALEPEPTDQRTLTPPWPTDAPIADASEPLRRGETLASAPAARAANSQASSAPEARAANSQAPSAPALPESAQPPSAPALAESAQPPSTPALPETARPPSTPALAESARPPSTPALAESSQRSRPTTAAAATMARPSHANAAPTTPEGSVGRFGSATHAESLGAPPARDRDAPPSTVAVLPRPTPPADAATPLSATSGAVGLDDAPIDVPRTSGSTDETSAVGAGSPGAAPGAEVVSDVARGVTSTSEATRGEPTHAALDLPTRAARATASAPRAATQPLASPRHVAAQAGPPSRGAPPAGGMGASDVPPASPGPAARREHHFARPAELRHAEGASTQRSAPPGPTAPSTAEEGLATPPGDRVDAGPALTLDVKVLHAPTVGRPPRDGGETTVSVGPLTGSAEPRTIAATTSRAREALHETAMRALDAHALARGVHAEVDLGDAGRVGVVAHEPRDVLDVRIHTDVARTADALIRHGGELMNELAASGRDARVTVDGTPIGAPSPHLHDSHGGRDRREPEPHAPSAPTRDDSGPTSSVRRGASPTPGRRVRIVL